MSGFGGGREAGCWQGRFEWGSWEGEDSVRMSQGGLLVEPVVLVVVPSCGGLVIGRVNPRIISVESLELSMAWATSAPLGTFRTFDQII